MEILNNTFCIQQISPEDLLSARHWVKSGDKAQSGSTQGALVFRAVVPGGQCVPCLAALSLPCTPVTGTPCSLPHTLELALHWDLCSFFQLFFSLSPPHSQVQVRRHLSPRRAVRWPWARPPTWVFRVPHRDTMSPCHCTATPPGRHAPRCQVPGPPHHVSCC